MKPHRACEHPGCGSIYAKKKCMMCEDWICKDHYRYGKVKRFTYNSPYFGERKYQAMMFVPICFGCLKISKSE